MHLVAFALLAAAAALQSHPNADLLVFPPLQPYAALAALTKPSEGYRILVARHGQSVGNRTNNDPRLSEAERDQLTHLGKLQAKELGAALRVLHVDVRHVVHSPAVRATQTAEIVAMELPSKPALVLIDDLRPLPTPHDPVIELLPDFQKRLQAAIDSIPAKVGKLEGDVLILAHAETVFGLASLGRGRDVKYPMEPVPNAAVAVVERAPTGALALKGIFGNIRPPAASGPASRPR